MQKNKMKNAIVIGGGIVGQSTSKALNIKNIFDKLKERSNINEDKVRDFKYLFICVQALQVEKVIRQFNKGHILIIRSTVIPGTADRLMKKYKCEIISNPEFLTETTAEEDSKNPDVIVLGSNDKVRLNDIQNIFYTKERFPNSNIILTDNKTAEMIKYAINVFYATKVIFANFLYQICEKEGIEYKKIKNAMYKRKWIGKNHLTVPYKNKFGLRGRCLPKDLITFTKYFDNEFFNIIVKQMENINKA